MSVYMHESLIKARQDDLQRMVAAHRLASAARRAGRAGRPRGGRSVVRGRSRRLWQPGRLLVRSTRLPRSA
jgi:hypothetical protein